MIDEIRARFLPRFAETAHKRVERVLALSGQIGTVAAELHTIAGEAAILGLTALADAARAGEAAAKCGDQPGAQAALQILKKGLDELAPSPRRSRGVVVIAAPDERAAAIGKALQARGFETHAGADLDAVVRLVRQHKPSIVVTPPGGDAETLTARVREAAGSSPVAIHFVEEGDDDGLARRLESTQ